MRASGQRRFVNMAATRQTVVRLFVPSRTRRRQPRWPDVRPWRAHDPLASSTGPSDLLTTTSLLVSRRARDGRRQCGRRLRASSRWPPGRGSQDLWRPSETPRADEGRGAGRRPERSILMGHSGRAATHVHPTSPSRVIRAQWGSGIRRRDPSSALRFTKDEQSEGRIAYWRDPACLPNARAVAGTHQDKMFSVP